MSGAAVVVPARRVWGAPQLLTPFRKGTVAPVVPVFACAAVPRPRLLRALDGEPTSERLLPLCRKTGPSALCTSPLNTDHCTAFSGPPAG
jgi:hypothetical protein